MTPPVERSGFSAFLAELRRRHVVRAAVLYVVVGLGVIEAADLLFARLGLPDWTVQLAVGLILVGFPIALVLAWAYELTPTGIQTQGAPESGDDSSEIGAGPPDAPAALSAPESREADVPVANRRIGSGRDTLLVLPFDNISPDAENEYFSDGLTEEIIATLSGIRALGVISRTSAMRLKGKEKDISSIRSDLGIRYVLEGSVRKAGEALRITAQLIDADTDEHLWAESYSGTTGEVFEIQANVAGSIAEALQIELSSEEQTTFGRGAVEHPVAYESYLRARHEMWSFSRQGLERARHHVRNAIDLVGDNELLLGTLGVIEVQYVQTGVDSDPKHLEAAEACADRIFRLDADSRHGHRLRGMIRFVAGDLREARPHLESALERDPDDPDTLAMLGYLWSLIGREDRALRLFDRLLRIDPLTPLNHAMPGFVAVLQGRFEDALGPYRTFLEMDDRGPFSMAMWVWVLCSNGRPDESKDVLDELRQRHPDDLLTRMARAYVHAMDGERAEASRALSPALLEAGRRSEMFSRLLAEIHALIGDIDASLDWLENAIEMGHANYPYLARWNPFLANVRDTPRFAKLMEGVRAEWSSYQDPDT